MSRAFASRTEVLNSSNEHLRYVPRPLAKAMVDAGTAAIANVNGKVKSVRLVETAERCAQRIGEPTPPGLGGVKFVRKPRLDTPSLTWEFHPRSLYERPE